MPRYIGPVKPPEVRCFKYVLEVQITCQDVWMSRVGIVINHLYGYVLSNQDLVESKDIFSVELGVCRG